MRRIGRAGSGAGEQADVRGNGSSEEGDPLAPRWTIEDVCDYLRLDERTVRRLGVPRIELRRHPAARPMVRYEPAEVRAWWEAQKARTRRTTTARRAG